MPQKRRGANPSNLISQQRSAPPNPRLQHARVQKAVEVLAQPNPPKVRLLL